MENNFTSSLIIVNCSSWYTLKWMKRKTGGISSFDKWIEVLRKSDETKNKKYDLVLCD